MATRKHLPLVKGLQLGVVLQAALVDEELHALEERGSDCRRLLPQQHIDWLGSRNAKLRGLAHVTGTALWILAVN